MGWSRNQAPAERADGPLVGDRASGLLLRRCLLRAHRTSSLVVGDMVCGSRRGMTRAEVSGVAVGSVRRSVAPGSSPAARRKTALLDVGVARAVAVELGHEGAVAHDERPVGEAEDLGHVR